MSVFHTVLHNAASARRKKLHIQKWFDCERHTLSVVIPAYNEELRIDNTLRDMLFVLEEHKNAASANNAFSYEVIVVDDGSTDSTAELVRGFQNNSGCLVRLLCLGRNHGKGHAVKHGMLHATGGFIMYCDADGATPFSEFELLMNEMKILLMDSDLGVVCGVRTRRDNSSLVRRCLSVVFHYITVLAIQTHRVKDTQCGFKLFTRESAMYLVRQQELSGWAFDVELLFLAIRDGHPVRTVPVEWTDVPGSKISLLFSPLHMLFEIVAMRARHFAMPYVQLFPQWRRDA